MNVGIDIQNLLLQKTGVGHYVYELVSSLAGLDVDDEFVLFYFSRNRAVDLPFLNERVREHRVGFPPGRLLSFLWKRLPFPKLDRFVPEFDVYHFPNFFIRPHRRGKTVVTIYDLSFLRYPQYAEGRNLAFLTTQVKHAVEKADRIIAASHFTRNEIIDAYGVEDSKVEVIHGGVGPEFGGSVFEEVIDGVREKHGLPKRFVLFVGTIEPRKNLLGLIEGFKVMRESSPDLTDVKLVVCGMEGWLCEETLRRMEQPDVAGHIVRVGYLDSRELPAIYSAAEAVALASWYEGFGFPCVEGMASKTPVLCSKESSMSEITGGAAILVDPSDTNGIAQGLTEILSNEELRQDLVRKGLDRVREFSWEKTARRTYEVYRSVL